MCIMWVILPLIEINNINEDNYFNYSDLFLYKKKNVVSCCPSCLILRFSEKKKIC